MNRAREDCDSDLSRAKREKEKIKQQLDEVADEVTRLNEEYEATKTESRDVQLTIGTTQIEIKNVDKEIFRLQQDIKIKMAELDHSSDNDNKLTKGTTLNDTQDTVMQATNVENFLQIEDETDMSFDQKMKDGGWRTSGNYHAEGQERRDTYGQIQQRRMICNTSGGSDF